MSKNYIIVSNHYSAIEPIVSILSFTRHRPVGILVRKKQLDNWFIRTMMQSAALAAPVKTDDKATTIKTLKWCKYLLNNGASIYIAPEGTRGKTRELKDSANGISWIIVNSSNTEVVPIGVWSENTNQYTSMDFFISLFSRRTKVHCSIGNPFTIKVDKSANKPNIYENVANLVMFEIAKLLPPEYRGKYSTPYQFTGLNVVY